jgi:hypothetical protein
MLNRLVPVYSPEVPERNHVGPPSSRPPILHGTVLLKKNRRGNDQTNRFKKDSVHDASFCRDDIYLLLILERGTK